MQIYCIFLSTSLEKSLPLLRISKKWSTFAVVFTQGYNGRFKKSSYAPRTLARL